MALAPRQGSAAQVGKGLLEPNYATKEQLLTVPGIDATMADAIIKGRPYLDALALDKVLATKLTAEQRTEVYRKLWVPFNLNTGAREEVLLIPGAGTRMAREFFEYRPWDGLARFRREIGKYVDAAEVARLEQYVFVPINLNTASDEDILTIPGTGPRMLREFKEYRPYDSMEKFRRELGKYVDKNQVALFERYLIIK
jgi:DNA uptake protein ComE-like DNA-binding protein